MKQGRESDSPCAQKGVENCTQSHSFRLQTGTGPGDFSDTSEVLTPCVPGSQPWACAQPCPASSPRSAARQLVFRSREEHLVCPAAPLSCLWPLAEPRHCPAGQGVLEFVTQHDPDGHAAAALCPQGWDRHGPRVPGVEHGPTGGTAPGSAPAYVGGPAVRLLPVGGHGAPSALPAAQVGEGSRGVLAESGVSLSDGIGSRGALGQLCSEAVSAGPRAESRAPTGKSLLAPSAGGPAPEVPKRRHQQPPAHGQGRSGPPASRAPCALRLSASAGPAPPPEAGSRAQPSPPPSHPADLGLCRHAVTLVLLATAPRCHSRSRPRSAPWSSSPLARPAVPPHGAAGRPRPAAFALRSWLLAGSSHSAPSALQPLLGTSPRQVSGL